MHRLFVLAFAAGVVLLAKPARADITIAVAGPFTGSSAAFGEQMRRGADKAVADLNAQGGVLGQKVVLLYGDDACDPKQSVSVANDLVSRNVVLVTGHFCSGSSIPASDVYAEANIIEISPASTSPKFTERQLTNVFRLCGRDDAQGPTAAAYLTQHFPGARVAIVHDKSAYGKDLADQFKKALNERGTQEIFYEAITSGEKDFSSLVSRLKSLKADVVYFGGYSTDAGLIVRQIRGQGLTTRVVGGDGLVTEEFWSITGQAGAGTLMTFGPDPRLVPSNAALVAWFRAQKYEPEAYTLYTYGSVQAWAQAVRNVGTTESAKVEAALHRDTFDTVVGKVNFDAKGDVTGPSYAVYVWKDGKYSYAP